MASEDFSFETADLTVWTIVEGAVVNVAASIPLLKPLVDLLFGKGYMDDSWQQSCPPEHGNKDLDSDMELRSSHGRRSSATTTNILQSILGDDSGSQDTILGEGNSYRADQRHMVRSRYQAIGEDPAAEQTSPGILKTQDITIT